MNSRFLLTQRACIEGYPPTLHQAAILAGNGQVVVLDAVLPEEVERTLTPPSVERVRIVKRAANGRAQGALARFDWLRQFAGAFGRELRRAPDVVIAYDPEASCIMLRASGERAVRVVHFHEVWSPDSVAVSPVARYALGYTLKNMARADLVVVADSHRAHYLQREARLARLPFVVMNCPRLLPRLPESNLLPFLRARGLSASRVVHYQGAVGPDHNLDRVILSMRWWPQDAVLVVVGGGRVAYQGELEALAAREGVGGRVVFVGRVPYNEVFAWAMGASVGVTLLDCARKNWELSAGASNKRFEYMALGIPQVTNDGPGIRELFERPGMAGIADYESEESIGRAIAALLNDPEGSAAIGRRARALHLERFNYESQFAPLLAEIERLRTVKGAIA